MSVINLVSECVVSLVSEFVVSLVSECVVSLVSECVVRLVSHVTLIQFPSPAASSGFYSSLVIYEVH